MSSIPIGVWESRGKLRAFPRVATASVRTSEISPGARSVFNITSKPRTASPQ